MKFFKKGDSVKIGVAAICTLFLLIISGPLGLVFGLAWAAGFLNGRSIPLDETEVSD